MHYLKKSLCALLVCALIPVTAVAAENNDIKHAPAMRAFRPFEQGNVSLFGADDDIISTIDEAIEYALREVAKNKPVEIDISNYNIPCGYGEVLRTRLQDSIRFSHPELFYLSAYSSYRYIENANLTAISLGAVTVDGGGYEYTDYGYTILDDEYKPDIEEINLREALVEAETKKILSLINDDMSTLQKITTVHDYIVANYTYDFMYTSRTLDTMIMEGTGVCQGYAYLFYHIMNRLGIPCINVPSDYCGHIWNKVQIDGEWYNIDTTHDDPKFNTATYDYSSGNKRSHFLLSDAELKSLATPDENGYFQCEQHIAWNDESYCPATSNAYQGSAYRDIMSFVVKKGDKAYCFDRQNNFGIIDFNSNSFNPIYDGLNSCKWYVSGSNSYYTIPFSATVLCKGDIYFNSPDKIYRFNTDTNTAEEFYEYEGEKNASNTYFYGLRTDGNKLYAEYSENPNGDLTLIPVDVPDPDEPYFPCSAEIKPAASANSVIVTADIPEKYADKSVIRVAQYNNDNIFIGFANPSKEDSTLDIQYVCDDDCKTVKAFIWGVNSFILTPYSTVSKFTFEE